MYCCWMLWECKWYLFKFLFLTIAFQSCLLITVMYSCWCGCRVGHMLDILSQVGDGRSWLEKVHQDYCGVQVQHSLSMQLWFYENIIRVRTILALGIWVLGNICRYWIVLLLGDIFFHCDTQYDTNQTAVSTVHVITIVTSVVRPSPADDSSDSGEGLDCKLYIIIIQFWDFMCYTVVYISLQNQYIAMLHSSISIGIGYWYR